MKLANEHIGSGELSKRNHSISNKQLSRFCIKLHQCFDAYKYFHFIVFVYCKYPDEKISSLKIYKIFRIILRVPTKK